MTNLNWIKSYVKSTTIVLLISIIILFYSEIIDLIIHHLIPVLHAYSESQSSSPDSSESVYPTHTVTNPKDNPLNIEYWKVQIRGCRVMFMPKNTFTGQAIAEDRMLGNIATKFYDDMLKVFASQVEMSQPAEVGRNRISFSRFSPSDVADHFTPDGIEVSSDSTGRDASESTNADTSYVDQTDEKSLSKNANYISMV